MPAGSHCLFKKHHSPTNGASMGPSINCTDPNCPNDLIYCRSFGVSLIREQLLLSLVQGINTQTTLCYEVFPRETTDVYRMVKPD